MKSKLILTSLSLCLAQNALAASPQNALATSPQNALAASTPTASLPTAPDHTSVNLRDGSFEFFAARDKAAPLGALSLKYSSRMNSMSHFGLGWCSQLDAELKVNRSAELELHLCDQILRYQKVKAAQLTEDQTLFFTRNDDRDDQIELNPFGYIRRHRGQVWNFDNEGMLVSSGTRETTQLQILSRKPTSWSVQAEGQVLQLTVGASGLVSQIHSATAPTVQDLHFYYDGARLVKMTATGTAGWSFKYDSGDNMTGLENPGLGVKNFIEYDRSTDRVLAVEGRRVCAEKFDYELVEGPLSASETEPSSFTARAQSTLDCPQFTKLLTRIDVQYFKLKDGQVLIRSFSGATEGNRRNVRFHPIFGTTTKSQHEKIEGLDFEFVAKQKQPPGTKTRLANQ